MDNVDRRTTLAGDRTIYAAERTYAAWVRTGLVALASGVGAKATLGDVMPEVLIIGTGTIMVLFSAFCFGMGVFREIKPGPPPPEPDIHRIPRALLVVINGFLVLVALAAMVGIWFGKTGG
jgi:putative membrane protein